MQLVSPQHLMRASVIAFALALTAAAWPQSAPAPVPPAPAARPDAPPPPPPIPAVDIAFYTELARSHFDGAADEDIAFSRDGRAGVIRFHAPVNGCRSFFVRESGAGAPRPVVGRVCTAAAAGEPPVVRDLRRAAAAADGPTRGLRPRQPSGPGGGGAAGPPPAPPAPMRPPSPTEGVGPSTQPEIKPALVDLLRTQPRLSTNRGHAVVLLSDAPAASARNRALCAALLQYFEDADYASIPVGVTVDPTTGALRALRAVYWLLDERRPAAAGDRCARKISQYNFVRARTIRDNYRLTGDGPHLLVVRDDERQAAALDLAPLANSQMANAVRMFRDGFSQRDDIWDPARFAPTSRRETLIAFFGQTAPQAIAGIFGLVDGPTSRPGCRRTDPTDAVACRP